MRCGQVYTILELLIRQQPFAAEQTHIEYVIEKGLVRKLSPEQAESWKIEVKELPGLEEQLRYHDSMKDSAQNQKTAKYAELDKIKGWRRYLMTDYPDRRASIEKDLFNLEATATSHKNSAEKIKPCVKLLREMGEDLKTKTETLYGILCITEEGRRQLSVLGFTSYEKDYETFKREITPRITL